MSLSPSTLPSASYVCTFAVVPALGRFGHLRLIVYAFDRFGFHLHDVSTRFPLACFRTLSDVEFPHLVLRIRWITNKPWLLCSPQGRVQVYPP